MCCSGIGRAFSLTNGKEITERSSAFWPSEHHTSGDASHPPTWRKPLSWMTVWRAQFWELYLGSKKAWCGFIFCQWKVKMILSIHPSIHVCLLQRVRLFCATYPPPPPPGIKSDETTSVKWPFSGVKTLNNSQKISFGFSRDAGFEVMTPPEGS